jgi:predicted Holliday junction resolvase-like endonuclease
MQKIITDTFSGLALTGEGVQVSYSSIFLVVLILCACVGIGYIWGRFLQHRVVMRERSDAVGRSRSVILGELYETIAPLMPGFRYAPRDMVFLGKGVDYLVFDGLSEGHLREIVFLELKTGKSKQNFNEKAIEQCLQRGSVRYELERK